MHSQQLNEPPLQPWVILSSCGKVNNGHCTCMAGLAKSCTHVGPLLFKIEAAVRIQGTKTVTDVPAYWMMPSNVDKVRVEVALKIDFTSGAAQRKELDRRISIRTRAGNMSSCEHNPTLFVCGLSPLLSVLHTHSKAVCLIELTIMEDYYQHYTDPVSPRIQPKSLLQLHNTGKYGCELSLLQQHCEGLADITPCLSHHMHILEITEPLDQTVLHKNK